MDWWREKKEKEKKKKKLLNLERGAMLLEELIECCDGKSNPIKSFSAHQIHEATKYCNIMSFGSSEWLTGGNETHPMILVKRLHSGLEQRSFCRDIAISSMVSGHKNFLKLVGCCLESVDPFMVYHGVKKHVKLDKSELSWKRRMKIAEDIATAFAYLHTAFPRPFVYGSLIPDNILLDEDLVAKLSDFSDCVSIPKGETFVKVNRIYYSVFYNGDIYKDSKYWRDGVVSVETDVYAFGMLMQMLLHGCHEVWVHKLFHRITRKERSDDEFEGTHAAYTNYHNKSDVDTQMFLLKLIEEGRTEAILKIASHADLRKVLNRRGLISEEEVRNGLIDVGQLYHRITGKEISDDSIIEREVQSREIQNWLLKLMEEGRMDEIADPKMQELMGEISEEELRQMKAFLMLSQRCIGLRGEIPTMVDVAKELKKIQRSLRQESSSPSGETQFDSPQDIASSSQTRH